MKGLAPLLKYAVAAFLSASLAAGAQTKSLDDMYAELKGADEVLAQRLEREIWTEWSKSGSAAMDLLLQRGRDAMKAGKTAEAIDHFSALIDHDPAFAEGWNARATAYFQAGQYGPSIADIGHVLALNPRHFGALSGLGAIFEQIGQDERALTAYREALAIHPHLEGVEEAIERLEKKIAGVDL
jgi:tetratricopeptide (TPR) repeat protein